MASLKTNEVKAVDDGKVQERLAGNVASSNVLFFEATYVTTGAEAASGDTIEVCDLPVGAIVLPELCRIAHEDGIGGSVVALPKLGDAADDDRYSATSFSVHSSNAAQALITPNALDGVVNRTPVTAATKRVIATFSRTNALSPNRRIKFIIAYRPRG